MGRTGNVMQALMGLSYLSSITSHFLSALHWMVFNLCFIVLRESENDLKFAMLCSTKFQCIVECCLRIRKHCQCIQK